MVPTIIHNTGSVFGSEPLVLWLWELWLPAWVVTVIELISYLIYGSIYEPDLTPLIPATESPVTRAPNGYLKDKNRL